MSRIVYLFLLFLVFNCGGETSKKEKKIYKVSKLEPKTTTAKKTPEIIDLSNTGIGPITQLVFEDLDEALAKKGGEIFKQKCTACHKTDKKSIGPAMKGVYKRRSPEWVMNMMLNPTEMLKKDPIAIAQLKAYNNVLMINQNLSNDEARAIAEFLRTIK